VHDSNSSQGVWEVVDYDDVVGKLGGGSDEDDVDNHDMKKKFESMRNFMMLVLIIMVLKWMMTKGKTLP
jgi:hypothetical protein